MITTEGSTTEAHEKRGESLRCIHGVNLRGTCALCEAMDVGQPVRLVKDRGVEFVPILDSERAPIHRAPTPAEPRKLACMNPDCIDGQITAGCAIDKPLLTRSCPDCNPPRRDWQSNKHNIPASDTPAPSAAREVPPERIRVVIRAGKENWIGVAYAPDAPLSDAIVEYISKAAHDAEVEKLRDALREIARQKLTSEIEPIDGEVLGDFEGAYDMMIAVARAALASVEGEG